MEPERTSSLSYAAKCRSTRDPSPPPANRLPVIYPALLICFYYLIPTAFA